MKTDFYTKTMLTLIALFLAVISFEKVYGVAVPEAEAKSSSVKWECSSPVDENYLKHLQEGGNIEGTERDKLSKWELREYYSEAWDLDDLANDRGWSVVLVEDYKTGSYCGHK